MRAWFRQHRAFRRYRAACKAYAKRQHPTPVRRRRPEPIRSRV